MPCFFKHSRSAVRVAVEPPLEEADVEVEVVPGLLVELVPQAAIARLATIAASASMSRSARRRWLPVDLMVVLSGRGDQLVVLEPLVAGPLVPVVVVPVPLRPVLVPESLTEVAVMVPLAWIIGAVFVH
jgi:hypothetical protein